MVSPIAPQAAYGGHGEERHAFAARTERLMHAVRLEHRGDDQKRDYLMRIASAPFFEAAIRSAPLRKSFPSAWAAPSPRICHPQKVSDLFKKTLVGGCHMLSHPERIFGINTIIAHWSQQVKLF
jgi:hypothetical protein